MALTDKKAKADDAISRREALMRRNPLDPFAPEPDSRFRKFVMDLADDELPFVMDYWHVRLGRPVREGSVALAVHSRRSLGRDGGRSDRMNRTKWMKRDVPIVNLALKLQEEAAEVGTAINDMFMDGEAMEPPFTREPELQVEIDHVRFFCDIIEMRLNGA
jgi:hypothetical protein